MGDRKKYAKTQLTKNWVTCNFMWLRNTLHSNEYSISSYSCQISVKVRFVVFKRNVLKTVDYVLNSLQGGTAILVYVLKFAQFPGTLPSLCLASKV